MKWTNIPPNMPLTCHQVYPGVCGIAWSPPSRYIPWRLQCLLCISNGDSTVSYKGPSLYNNDTINPLFLLTQPYKCGIIFRSCICWTTWEIITVSVCCNCPATCSGTLHDGYLHVYLYASLIVQMQWVISDIINQALSVTFIWIVSVVH